MKILLLSTFVMWALFLPSDAEAADGRNKRKAKQAKIQSCKAMKGRARKNCEAKQIVAKKGSSPANCNRLKGRVKKKCESKLAAAEARRKELARQAELRRQAEIRRRIEVENGLRKTTKDNITSDSIEGEDLEIRKMAVDSLGNNAGTVVVMETQTGKIKTIVNQNWAIRNAYEPCSTIKLVTTVAGLEEHVIDEEDQESRENLEYALAKSQNGYFQQIGKKFDYSKFTTVGRELGLGRPTGINVVGENPGQLSLVRKTSQVYSHGYGVKTTALQQAVMISTLVNKGKKIIPQIPVKSGDVFKFEPRAESIKLSVKDLEGAIPGMKAVAEYGTARKGVDSELGIVGKTGTCSATGTFTSLAPIDNPKYTVVVILRGERGKGRYAAKVAGEIYQKMAEVGLIPKPAKLMELPIVASGTK